jgi:hypothetical protein
MGELNEYRLVNENSEPIQTILLDGSFSGAMSCILPKRRIRAYKVRRKQYAHFLNQLTELPFDKSCLGKACVYILLGNEISVSDKPRADDNRTPKKYAYIGETTDILGRLNNHHATKEEWDDVIIFFRADEDLDKAQAVFVETRLIEIARDTANSLYELENTRKQNKVLTDFEYPTAEHIIKSIQLITTALGYPLFVPQSFVEYTPDVEPVVLPEPVKPTVTNTTVSPEILAIVNQPTLFVLLTKEGDVFAKGVYTYGKEFIVLKDSKFVSLEQETRSLRVYYRNVRNSLVKSKVVVDNVFQEDCKFTTPSGAAYAVLGGYRCWYKEDTREQVFKYYKSLLHTDSQDDDDDDDNNDTESNDVPV